MTLTARSEINFLCCNTGLFNSKTSASDMCVDVTNTTQHNLSNNIRQHLQLLNAQKKIKININERESPKLSVSLSSLTAQEIKLYPQYQTPHWR